MQPEVRVRIRSNVEERCRYRWRRRRRCQCTSSPLVFDAESRRCDSSRVESSVFQAKIAAQIGLRVENARHRWSSRLARAHRCTHHTRRTHRTLAPHAALWILERRDAISIAYSYLAPLARSTALACALRSRTDFSFPAAAAAAVASRSRLSPLLSDALASVHEQCTSFSGSSSVECTRTFRSPLWIMHAVRLIFYWISESAHFINKHRSSLMFSRILYLMIGMHYFQVFEYHALSEIIQ